MSYRTFTVINYFEQILNFNKGTILSMIFGMYAKVVEQQKDVIKTL